MNEKYLYDVIDDFIDENCFNNDEIYCLELMQKFLTSTYSRININKVSENTLNKFIFAWLPTHIKYLGEENIDCIVKILNKFILYIRDIYNVQINRLNDEFVIYELRRVYRVNREIDRFLNNPVLSYSPMIIDIETYKKRSMRNRRLQELSVKEKGYFFIADIWNGRKVIFKNLYTCKFFNVDFDIELIKFLRVNDIVYADLSQDFLSWRVSKIFKYFPYEAKEYINLKGFKKK